MCVEDVALNVLWVDAEDALLAARHHVPLLISASSDEVVVRAARELHELSFPGAAPLVTFRASGFVVQPAQFAAQWNALCRAARTGTILLTDIDKMRSPAQLLLLDALRDRAASRPRVISGTSVPLMTKVLSGEFCEELFYRLNVIHLMVRDGQ